MDNFTEHLIDFKNKVPTKHSKSPYKLYLEINTNILLFEEFRKFSRE